MLKLIHSFCRILYVVNSLWNTNLLRRSKEVLGLDKVNDNISLCTYVLVIVDYISSVYLYTFKVSFRSKQQLHHVISCFKELHAEARGVKRDLPLQLLPILQSPRGLLHFLFWCGLLPSTPTPATNGLSSTSQEVWWVSSLLPLSVTSPLLRCLAVTLP